MPPQVRRGNLPSALTSFVGRRREVSDVRRLLGESRLLTLTGPGGTGKTRLALYAAADVSRTFPDGVWLFALDQLRDATLLTQTVATTLGLREQSAEWPIESLQAYLAPRHVLLVFDNCEHLVDSCAKLADRLLRDCPHLRVLATSREPLNIGGEMVFAVPPLSLPSSEQSAELSESARSEAIGLFVSRAERVVPEFQLTEDNHVAVAGICLRLGGLPLAIELAAARMRVLSPDEILARLDRPHRLLTRGPRDVPERQQTLLASIRWSYDLCTAAERQLWARLSVFAGDFELDAAEAVGADDEAAAEDVLDLVTALVDKSVLVREQQAAIGRFRMLEILREFGLEELHESGESVTVHGRHRDYYEGLAGRMEMDWIGPRQAQWLARLDREHANLRAVLTFCLQEHGGASHALGIMTTIPHYYWWTRGLLTEGRYWLRRALAQVDEPSPLRVRALLVDAQLSIGQGAFNPSSLDEAGQLAQRFNDPRTLAFASYVEGLGALWTGGVSTAHTALRRALATASNGVDLDIELEARTVLTVLRATDCAGTNNIEEVTALFDAVHERSAPHGEIFHRMYARWAVGIAAWCTGDLPRAQRVHREALRWAHDLDDRNGLAWCLEPLAWVAAARHDYIPAATLLGAASALWSALRTGPEAFRDLHGFHLECHRQVSAALGDAGFTAENRKGESMSIDACVAFALDDSARAPGPDADTTSPPSVQSPLTRRERQIAGLVAEGLSNKEIAARLFISQRTAESHVQNVLIKMGFKSRAQVATWVAAQPECAGSPAATADRTRSTNHGRNGE